MAMNAMHVGCVSFAAILAGCSSTPVAHTAGTAAPRGTENTRSINHGQHTRIGLPSNPSTGFGWSLDQSGSTGLDRVKVKDEGFIATDSGLLGAPGRRWWDVEGLHSGTASLRFVYQRAWERDTPPAKTRTLAIHVR